MLKKTYIVIMGIIFLLSYHEINYAAATTISTSVSQSGSQTGSITISTQTHTNVHPINTETEQVEQTDGTIQENVWANYEVTYNLQSQLPGYAYYNGYINFQVSINTDGEGYKSFLGAEHTFSQDDGLRVYIGAVNGGRFQVYVTFDNYINRTTNIDLGQVIWKDSYYISNPNNIGLERNYTTTISVISSNVESSSSPTNNRLSNLIYNAVEQSTFQDFDTIIGWLNAIYDDDLDTFQDMITILSSSNTFLSHIDTYTQNIYSKISNIDTNVGTILTDLESYITFMRQYIPYLNNISTNTLNIYNQLVTILTYMQNRPTAYLDIRPGELAYRNGKTQKENTSSTNVRRAIIQKEQNIQYIYLNNNANNNTWAGGTIFYYENYQDIYQETPTRVIQLPVQGLQYVSIDFKYNENTAVVNLSWEVLNNKEYFKAYIGDGYTYSALLYYIDMMQNMNEEQSSLADEQNEEYATKENEAASVAAAAEITMPDISNISFDINSHIDQNTKSNWFTFLSMIVNNNYITTLLLICITAMIAGYILYGKKS